MDSRWGHLHRVWDHFSMFVRSGAFGRSLRANASKWAVASVPPLEDFDLTQGGQSLGRRKVSFEH